MSVTTYPHWLRSHEAKFNPLSHTAQFNAIECLDEWETAATKAYWSGDVQDEIKAEILRREYKVFLEEYRDWYYRQLPEAAGTVNKFDIDPERLCKYDADAFHYEPPGWVKSLPDGTLERYQSVMEAKE